MAATGAKREYQKRALSWMLALMLMLSLLPPARAEEPGTDPAGELVETVQAAEIESGGEGGAHADALDETDEADTGAPDSSGEETISLEGDTAPGEGETGSDPEEQGAAGQTGEDAQTGHAEGGPTTDMPEGAGEMGESASPEDSGTEDPASDEETEDLNDAEETESEALTGEEAADEDTEGEGAEAEDGEEEEPDVLPNGFAGMPEGTVLSKAELAAKAALREHGLPERMNKERYEEGVVLLVTSDSAYAETVAEAYSAELIGFYGNFAELALTTATALEAVTAAADPDIPLPAVEPNWLISLSPGSRNSTSESASYAKANADDPYEWADWVGALGLDDPLVQDPWSSRYQWMHDAVNSYAAWGMTMGSSAVRVAVLDTGIATGHEDFGLVESGANTISKVTTADVEDDSGHGTHVSGIIAAQGFNGVGGVGIAPGVTLLPVRVLSEITGSGSMSSVARGVNWAVAHGADIINMSLGGTGYSTVLETALEKAYQAGVTLIAAMSNNKYGGSNLMYYPAAYDHVIGVGASDQGGHRAYYSHYGSWCDVYAPGSDIWSCWLSGYFSNSGTSMAAPVVSGIAALYMSVFGHQDPDTMERVLEAAADSSTGVIDAAELFSSDRSAPVFKAVEADGSEAAREGNKVQLTSAGQIYIESDISDDGSRILYTLDGKTPAMLDGEIRCGTLLPAGEGISLTDRTVGETLTVTAVRVSGLGIASRPASLKVEIVSPTEPQQTEEIYVEITNLPKEYVVAGKTWEFRGEVLSSLGTAVDQKLIWSITEQSEGMNASIDPKTGILTTRKGETGSVRVRAIPQLYPENPGAEAMIRVETILPTATMVLNLKTAEMDVPSAEALKLEAVCRDARNVILDNDDVGLLWTSSNEKVAMVDQNGFVTATGRGSATVKVTAKDGSGKTAGCRITVRQSVTEIRLTGQSVVTPGSGATVKAVVSPSNANNKDVAWEIRNLAPEDADVRISSTGRVSVGRRVPIGTQFEVVVRAKDGSGTVSDAWTVQVLPETKSVLISPSEEPYFSIRDRKGVVTGAVLYRLAQPTVVHTGGSVGPNDQLGLDAVRLCDSSTSSASFRDAIIWHSSDPKIATVDESGIVTACGVGSATIIASADDGSGQKAKFTIRVINPVSSLKLISAAPLNCTTLAFGYSIKTTAALGDTYGRPSLTALNWSFLVRNENGAADRALTELLKARQIITLNSSGMLRVKAGARNYDVGSVVVTAKTTDGSELSDSITYDIVEGTTKVQLWEYSFPERTQSSSRSDISLDTVARNVALPMKSTATYYVWSDGPCETFAVESGNPKVAGAVIGRGSYTDSRGRRQTFVQLQVTTGIKSGWATITVQACDGSGKSTAFRVHVP